MLYTAGTIHCMNKNHFFHLPFQNVWNHSVLKNNKSLPLALLTCNLVFRLINLKLDSHRHSGDNAGTRTEGVKDERHFKSEQG